MAAAAARVGVRRCRAAAARPRQALEPWLDSETGCRAMPGGRPRAAPRKPLSGRLGGASPALAVTDSDRRTRKGSGPGWSDWSVAGLSRGRGLAAESPAPPVGQARRGPPATERPGPAAAAVRRRLNAKGAVC